MPAQWRTAAARSGHTGVLLGIELAGAAGNFASGLGGRRALSGIGALGNHYLVHYALIEGHTEDSIADFNLFDFLPGNIINWNLHVISPCVISL
jgi:hypothetical protein